MSTMPRKLLFVLADGGRARFVERSPSNGHFSQVEEMDQLRALLRLRREVRATPPGRANSSTSPRRSAVGQEDYARPAKEAFMAAVADRAVELVRQRGLEGVFLAAPPQLIGPLRIGLEGRTPVIGAIRKDLTKTPEHELGAWLNDAYRAPWLSA